MSKTAALNELAQQTHTLSDWLRAGKTALLIDRGQLLGRMLPEPNSVCRELFAKRFAPLDEVPDRDLSDVVSENKGQR